MDIVNVVPVGHCDRNASNEQKALYAEILTLRAKVASAEVLVEALRFYAEKHNWIDVEVKNGNHFAAIVNTDRVPDFVNYYKSSIATAGKRAIEALATYDKLSEVKHDTK